MATFESPNANNSSYNRKNVKTTFDAGLVICVSFANEGKTQVKRAAIVGWKMQKWVRSNNIHPNGSPCCVPNFNKMTMRSPCSETLKNI